MKTRVTIASLLLVITVGMATVAEEKHSEKKPRTWLLPILPKVHITEVCVIPPPGKNWPAWVELWNNGSTNIDITGYSLATLQATYKPFQENTVMRPNERLVVLFYVGDKKDDDFEKRIPAAARKVRVFNTTVFPPYMSLQQWNAKLPGSFKEGLLQTELRGVSPAEQEDRLAGHTVVFVGSTRFINELALRTPDGDLVGYVGWGDKQRINWGDVKQYQSAGAEASEKGVLFDVAARTFAGLDSECVVLQLLAPTRMGGDPEADQAKRWRKSLSGLYRPLACPEVNCSPGTPMKVDVKAPELLPAEPCSVGWYLSRPCVFLEIHLRWGRTEATIERHLGWSREVFEICLDPEMKRPVFRPNINRFWNPARDCLHLPLRPSVYKELAGKTLYVRASKRHTQKGILYSSVLEAKVSHDGRDPIPQDTSGTNSVPGMAELADSGANAEPQAEQVEPPEASSEGADEVHRLP